MAKVQFYWINGFAARYPLIRCTSVDADLNLYSSHAASVTYGSIFTSTNHGHQPWALKRRPVTLAEAMFRFT